MNYPYQGFYTLIFDTVTDRTAIIFFDGECNLCNGFVDLLLKVDRQQIFKLAPLQGKTAKRLLPPLSIDRSQWSIFYLEGNNLYSQSDAPIEIAKRLGGFWSLFTIAKLLPTIVRDRGYRAVAKNRYLLFGRSDICRLPNEADQSRFLP
jgi:predicted DCC family thiol-disulfide oxidoreductase YuxK